MLDELSADQLSEWEAYDSIDPVGSWRDDLRMGQICATIVRSIHAALSKSNCDVSALDFMPKWGGSTEGTTKKEKPEVKKQSVDEMKAILFAIAKHQNSEKTKAVKGKKIKNG